MTNDIIEILSGIRPEIDFSREFNFIECGIFDSFDIISIVDSLDQRFNIHIDGLDVVPENFVSIRSMENLIKKYGHLV